MTDPDFLILGGGIAGLSTAWHLGREGAGRVVVLERESTLGSMASGQNAAILRTFGTDPVTAEIARRSAAFLRCPPDGFSPVPLVDSTGVLLFASDETARRMREVARSKASLAREISALEVASLAPHFADYAASAADLCLWFPDEGRLDVAALLDGFASGARRAGVEIRTKCEVRELCVDDGRVVGVVLTDGRLIRAAHTVLAAGGWASRLGAAAGSLVELRPTRRHLMVTAADNAVDPSWPVGWVEDAGFYCRPESGGLLLCACDQVDIDPDRMHVDPTVKESIALKTTQILPRFAGAGAAHFWCGVRTLTADGRFVVGPDPSLGDLFWVAGLGGHGMTCGAEVGRIAARQLMAETAEPELDRALAPERLTCLPA